MGLGPVTGPVRRRSPVGLVRVGGRVGGAGWGGWGGLEAPPCPLLTTVMPPGDTTNPRARSCSLSTPTVAPSKTTTSLSRMAFSTTARRRTWVLSKITARFTRDRPSMWTPGDRTELLIRPPAITPLLTTLSTARPGRSPSEWTNFAGGWHDILVTIGHWSLYRLNGGITARRSMCALK